MNNKHLYLTTAALLLALSLGAQDRERQEYLREAGGQSTLFRGRLQSMYPIRFNGTYYLDTRTFQEGSVMFNGKFYDRVFLNLDAYAQELEARPEAQSSGVILARNQVSWFTLGNRRFVNLRYMGYDNAPEGYLEVVVDGRRPLLRLTRKMFRADNTGNGNAIYADSDGNYDPAVVNYFGREEQYFSLEDGQVKKLRRSAWRRRLQEPAVPAESPLSFSTEDWHPTPGTAVAGDLPARTFQGGGIGLPDGYFEDRKQDTTTVLYQNNALTATFRNKVYVIGEAGMARGGRAAVSGVIREAESGEPLPGVVVFDDNTSTYVRSNARGEYRISLPAGENVLNFNAESKEELALKVVLQSDGTLDVVLTEKITLLKGAMISAESMRQHRTTTIGLETVSIQTVGKIPSAFGEGDIIKAVLTLPGIKSVGEASGGFNVRGGSSDQNLILFNDNTIYNPSHLFGLFSAFNPDIVDNVELYKSSIPAEYGGRISSVLSVSTKEGDRQRVRGSVDIGLLTSRLHVEGPIGGKTTFVAGGRFTYSDWILKELPKSSAYAGGGAGFADANIGLTHRFDDRNSLQVFGYFANDRFSFSGDTTFRYTNINASVAWRHKGDDGSSSKFSAGYDHYTNIVGAHHWPNGAYDLQTYIRQAFLKARFEKPVDRHTLTYGLDAVGYALDPGIQTPFGEISDVKATALDREYALEPSLYLSDTWAITDEFSVDGGIRLSSFLALNPTKAYVGPEFRLSTKYTPVENLSFKAGLNTMRQYIHLISNTASVSPIDTWKLSGADIAPTTGWQGAAGIYWTILGAGLDLSLEGYYKESRNALDYKPGAVLAMNPRLADDLVPVLGRAYGGEVMVKKPAGRLTGWVSYSYSRSLLREMLDHGSETINQGNWYNAPYDKPHEFKMVGNLALTHRFSFSVNVDYSTGRPITVPYGRYRYGSAWHLAYSDRNTYRIPDYFRVDVAFNIDPGHYLKALAHASVTLGVYNVTGRKNPYSVFFRANPSGMLDGYMMSVFATQIPYINLNILF